MCHIQRTPVDKLLCKCHCAVQLDFHTDQQHSTYMRSHYCGWSTSPGYMLHNPMQWYKNRLYSQSTRCRGHRRMNQGPSVRMVHMAYMKWRPSNQQRYPRDRENNQQLPEHQKTTRLHKRNMWENNCSQNKNPQHNPDRRWIRSGQIDLRNLQQYIFIFGENK